MIASFMAIICLIFFGVSNACDPTLSGMTFYSPYIYTMPGSDWQLTHTAATGNSCNCGTIYYVWSKTAGTDGNAPFSRKYFLSDCTRTENYMPIGFKIFLAD